MVNNTTTSSAAALIVAAGGNRAAALAARRLDRLRPHDAAVALLDALRDLRVHGVRPDAGPLRDVLDALAAPPRRAPRTTTSHRHRAAAAASAERAGATRQEPEQ